MMAVRVRLVALAEIYLMLLRIIKRWFCHHDWRFRRNIYGDEINAILSHVYRSIYRCEKCGDIQFRGSLVFDECSPAKK